MRAAVYEGEGGTDVIAMRDVAEPVNGSDDALIDVAYAGLNRADVLERRGAYPAPKRDVVVPGIEYAGRVRAVGANVTGVAVGDRVCGLVQAGAHAQRLVTNALTCSKLSASVDWRTAAAVPEAFMTAFDALFTRGAFRFGETALVHAVGSSVGLAAIALVKRAGGVTIGTSRTPDKIERARELGLDFGFTLEEGWSARVMEASGGRGADVILDFVGAPMLDDNLRTLAAGGRIVQIGAMAGARANINLGILMAKRAALHGTVMRSRPLDEKIALAKHFSRDVLPQFARGELRVRIDCEFALDALADAHAYMERDANFGKILIAIAPDL